MHIESVKPEEERGFDVLEIALILARHWRLIALLTVGLGIFGGLFSYTLTPRYSAAVSFLVDQENSVSGSFLFRQTDPTISLLQSRAITEFVLQHIDVNAFAANTKKSSNEGDNRLALRARVQSETTATRSEQGVYVVQVQDALPTRAVTIANAYLDALQELSDRMSFEGATRSRSFYQQQVAAERASLEKAEADLKVQQERTGLLQPGSQTGMGLSQIAALRSQIVGLEVQRAQIAQSATAENPEMVRLNAQIAELQGKVNGLQGRITGASGQDLPSQSLDTQRLQREVAYHENLLTSLATQYERARLQENFSIPRVHVVDRAALPVPKTWPNRYAIAIASAVIGLFLGLIVTGCLEMLAHLRSDSVSAGKLTEIKRALLRRA
ncbi:MAG: GumC family protein [Janthinobacterium lividum]